MEGCTYCFGIQTVDDAIFFFQQAKKLTNPLFKLKHDLHLE